MAAHLRVGRARHEGDVRGRGAAAARSSTRSTPTADDLEGYLFPETYNLPRDAGGRDARRADGAALPRDLRHERCATRPRARGLTTRQVVTLASLIEKETSRPEERPLVSAVYQNRMRIGMGMQCDPTVIYALQRAGRWNGNLTPRRTCSSIRPTTRIATAACRPGPIAAPGRASLEAAVAPADVAVSLLRQPQRRVARLRGDARRAQPQRAPVSGPVFPGSASTWQKVRRLSRVGEDHRKQHRELHRERSAASAPPISVSAAGRRSTSAPSSGRGGARGRRA